MPCTTANDRPRSDTDPGSAPERASLSLTDLTDLIGARRMWELGVTGRGVNVAVVDTGVADVPAVGDRVVARVDLSADHADPTTAFVDRHGHGTHLAGIVAGRSPGADPARPDDHGYLGVAPDAGIVSVKVAGRDGEVASASLLSGIEWVIDHAAELDIRVLLLAFGAADADPLVEQALHAAVERAWSAGIVVVTAAGNDGDTGMVAPATNPWVVTVGSLTVDGDGVVASPFTSRGGAGRFPDVAAPGAHIESLRAPGSAADVEHPEGYVDDERFLASGSSQAAAVVAGVAALVLQHRPAAMPDQVKQVIVDAASPVMASSCAVGAGLVSAPGACFARSTFERQVLPRTPSIASPTAAGAALVPAGSTWMGNTWTGSTWMGSTWMGSTWMGNTWTGSTWMGNTWTGSTWMGSTWTGSTWMGSTWMGSTWMGSTWMGSTWMGNTWTGSTWM